MRFANQTATFGVAALLAAQPAMADVTPQQVWDDLDAYLQSFGYEVSATESMAGDTLTVSDLSLRLAIPDANGGLSMAMEQMTFTDTGDGSSGSAWTIDAGVSGRASASSLKKSFSNSGAL